MGKDKIVDKAISPQDIVRALAAGDITIAQAQQMYNGVMPIGDYKGAAAILDLDLLVKQPLVEAEQLHILGILDGREEDYDLQTIKIPSGSSKGASFTGQIEVPSGEVWFINAVEMVLPADQGGTPTMNWHCSLWTDRVGESEYGQPFHADDINFSPNGGTQWDELYNIAPSLAVTNKPVVLRLPAGEKITFVVTNTLVAATADMTCIGRVYGYIGKALVG